jgi:hypothetical protein
MHPYYIALIPPSESAYGSQFFIAKLLQVHKFEENETNIFSSSFVCLFIIYLPNCLKPLLSPVFLILIFQKLKMRDFLSHMR